jgi:hypothetical protein
MNDNSTTPRLDDLPVDVDNAIGRLADWQVYLSDYIDRHWDDLDVRQLARSLSVHGMNAVHLGRLLRDRLALGLSPYQPPAHIDDVIADLDDKLARLSQHIDRLCHDSEIEHWIRLISVYSHNVGRLSRLMCDRRALCRAACDEQSGQFQEAINLALDQLSAEWGIEL